MDKRRALSSTLGPLALVVFWSSAAAGSTTYPAQVRSVLRLASVPACTLCHVSDEGGDDTAIRPFGVTMVRLGALGNENQPSLANALALAAERRTDSDEDGTSDIDELRAGSDPNFAVGQEAPLTPMTGCAFGRRVEPPAWLALSAACAGFVLLTRRRRAS